jgi:hypothetical protein
MIIESFGQDKNPAASIHGTIDEVKENPNSLWIVKLVVMRESENEPKGYPPQWNHESTIDAVRITPEDIDPNLCIRLDPAYNSSPFASNSAQLGMNYCIRIFIAGREDLAFEVSSRNQTIIRCVFNLLLDNKDCTEEDIKEEHPEAFV